jgi:two-component system chemotaxis response regulator CheY
MKTLIVEDDVTSRVLLEEILKVYGAVHTATNGREGVEAVRTAVSAYQPYDLICLDIMMPEMDGYQVLKEIRAIEDSRGIDVCDGARIIMTSALHGVKHVMQALRGSCDAYLVKPINKAKLLDRLQELGLTGLHAW